MSLRLHGKGIGYTWQTSCLRKLSLATPCRWFQHCPSLDWSVGFLLLCYTGMQQLWFWCTFSWLLFPWFPVRQGDWAGGVWAHRSPGNQQLRGQAGKDRRERGMAEPWQDLAIRAVPVLPAPAGHRGGKVGVLPHYGPTGTQFSCIIAPQELHFPFSAHFVFGPLHTTLTFGL